MRSQIWRGPEAVYPNFLSDIPILLKNNLMDIQERWNNIHRIQQAIRLREAFCQSVLEYEYINHDNEFYLHKFVLFKLKFNRLQFHLIVSDDAAKDVM